MVTNLEKYFELPNKRTKKRTTDNKGLAIAGGTSKVHVLCFD